MKHVLVVTLLLSAACATSKSDSNAAGTTQPSTESADGGAASDGGAVTLQAELPGPGLGAGAVIAMDSRGAFGPVLATHLDIFPDDTAKCFQRRPLKKDAVNTITLSAEQKAAITREIDKAHTADAVQVKRKAIIQDIGTVTLSVVKDGKEVNVVTDGGHNVEPSQGDVTLLLGAITQQCLEGAPK